jgi:hypothetical protein
MENQTKIHPIGIPPPPPKRKSISGTKKWYKAAQSHGLQESDITKLTSKMVQHNKVRSGRAYGELKLDENAGIGEKAKMAALKKMSSSNTGKGRHHNLMGMSVMGYGKPVYDPFAAAHLPINVQIGFRRKMLGTLSLQLLSTFLLIMVFLYGMFTPVVQPLTGWTPDPPNATDAELAKYNGTTFTATFILAIVWGILLCIMFCVKHQYPANYVLLSVFTVFEALACALFSAFFTASNDSPVTMFGFFPRIILFATIQVPLIMYWSTRVIPIAELPDDARIMPDGTIGYDDEYKPKEHFFDEATQQYVKVMSFGNAAFRSWWVAAFICFPLFFTVLKGNNSPSAVVFSCLITILLSMWIAFDAQCLSLKMSPDEFMSAVVFFYTDLILLLLISAVIAMFIALMCCGGGGGDEAGSGGGADSGGADAPPPPPDVPEGVAE